MQHRLTLTVAALAIFATPMYAQRISIPFGGAVTRIPAPVVAVSGQPVALEGVAKETFQIYTKDSVGYDHGRVSPTVVLGYKNVRSDTHPWALEGGYKYADAAGGHQDLLLANAWGVAWFRGSTTRNASLTLEEDTTDTRSTQMRYDTYGIAEGVENKLTVDLLGGISTARTRGSGRTTDRTAGILPTLQITTRYAAQGLYSISNKLDGESYYEASAIRSFGKNPDKPTFQVSVVAAKHSSYAIRFQKTLHHFFARNLEAGLRAR